jgi:WD40 repeat protein
MAASRGDGGFTLVDLRTKRPLADLPARDGAAEAMAFTAGGRHLVTGSEAGTMTIWDVSTQEVVREPQPALGPVKAVAVSRGDRLLAIQSAGKDDQGSVVQVRDFRSGEPRYERAIPSGSGEVAFSPDGEVLVASGVGEAGSTVMAWDAASGDPLWDEPIAEQPSSFTIAPDSTLVAVGTADGRVQLWDLRTGDPRGPATKVAGAIVTQVAMSRDGGLLAAAAFDATATVWDLDSRTRIGEAFPIVRGTIPAVAFEPSGRLIVGELWTAIEWPLDRRSLQDFACQVAGRAMTRDEWRELLPNQPYRPVCG